MITQQTAADIWQCYREIEAGEKLLVDMEERKEKHPDDKYAQCLEDIAGRRRSLQLSIPSGSSGHKLIGVSQEIAFSVIRAHIAAKKAELAVTNEQARIELIPDVPPGQEIKREPPSSSADNF